MYIKYLSNFRACHRFLQIRTSKIEDTFIKCGQFFNAHFVLAIFSLGVIFHALRELDKYSRAAATID